MAFYEHLLDKHVDQTYKAFHQMPLNKNLRTAWLVICFFVVGFWYKSYFNDALQRENLCADYTGGDKDAATGVSKTFKTLTGCFFVQSILMFSFQLYQVIAINFVKPMLRYRMIVSRFNKLSLLFAGGLLFTTGLVRFGELGKFCSGDHLTSEERLNPKFSSKFAI